MPAPVAEERDELSILQKWCDQGFGQIAYADAA